jgi:hypothetical protein
MKKIAALLASVAVLWGSHAAAGEKILYGEEAIELILEAHDEGLILSKVEQSGISGGHRITMLLDRRYFTCRINGYDQICADQTGIRGEYEE